MSVLKRKTLFNQQGSFVHREFHGTESLIGCPSFFHFGTENWEGQLKEPPCITGTVRVFQTIFKCLHFDCLFFFVFIFNRWNCVGAHRGFLENFQMFHHCVALPGKASKPQRRSLVSLVDGRLELIIAKFSILMKNKVSEE